MKSATRLVFLLPLVAACASTTEVWFDDREDFARYRTWEWLSQPARTVEAATGAPELEARLQRALAAGLEARGLTYAPGRADLLVSYTLSVAQQRVVVHETPAVRQLSSMHSSPSYEVQATRQTYQVYERARLELVLLADPRRRRPVWRGEVAGLYRGTFPLKKAVGKVLGGFPPPSPERPSLPAASVQ